jgi:hypothetical protein
MDDRSIRANGRVGREGSRKPLEEFFLRADSKDGVSDPSPIIYFPTYRFIRTYLVCVAKLFEIRTGVSVMIASQIPAKLVATVPPSERQNKGELMTRILLLGLDPETVDFSDPALPPGMTVEKVRAGIAVALKQFTDRGWESDVGYIRPDETAGPTVERQLRSTNYDCVVIGGGVRLPPRNLALFEVVINAIRKTAPGAAIAFNTRPDDSADAAARWVAAGS